MLQVGTKVKTKDGKSGIVTGTLQFIKWNMSRKSGRNIIQVHYRKMAYAL